MVLRRGRARDLADDAVGSVLLNDIGLVKHVEFLCGITTSVDEDGLLASGVILQEICDIQNLTIHHNPNVLLGVVFGNFFPSVNLVLILGRSSGGGRGSGGGSGSRGSRGGGGGGGDDGGAAMAIPVDLDVELLRVGGDGDGGLHVALRDGGGYSGISQMVGKGGEPSGGTAESLREDFLKEVLGGAVTSYAAEHNAAEKGASSQSVGTVDSSSNLTAGEQAGDGSAVSEDSAFIIDLNTSHGEVDDGGDNADPEGIVHEERSIIEELLAIGILLGLDDFVVLVKGILEGLGGDSNVGGQSSTVRVELHQTTTLVVLAVPFDFLSTSAVQDEAVGRLVELPHLACYVISASQFIAEPLAFLVEKETSDSTQGFGGEVFQFSIGLLGIYETSRVDLDLLQIDSMTTNSNSQLDTVTSAVITVGGGEVQDVGSVFLQEGIGGIEIGSITTSGDDDGAVSGVLLAVLLVFNTNDGVTFLQESGDTALSLQLDAVGVALGESLVLLHQSVGDGHTGELLLTAVSSGSSVTSQTGNQREIKAEPLLQPLNSGGTVVGQNLDERRTNEFLGGLSSIFIEKFNRVLDAKANLCAGQSTVDTRSGLCRVSPQETIFIKKQNATTLLQYGVGSGQA